MSESPMGVYGSPAPEPMDAPDEPKRDPRLLIGGGIGLAVLALGGAYLFLGGGGGGSDAGTAIPPVVRHHATATPSATVIPVGATTKAVKVFRGDVGRDPFQALIAPTTPPVVKTTAAAPTGPAATTAPAGPTTPGTVVGPPTLPVTTVLPVTSGTPTPAPAPTTTAPVKIMVVLKAIAYPHGPTDPYVLVTFGGHQYMLKTGDTAAGSLKVLAIAPDDGTATFELGDQTFDLHIGQSYVD